MITRPDLLLRGGYELNPDEIQMDAVRAQGAGGQNVNKVSTAIHLRFDVPASSLPEAVKERILAKGDTRITDSGVIVLKAQRFRTQAQNREDALQRLVAMLNDATFVPKARRRTRPTRASKERRLKKKNINSRNKSLRGKPSLDS